MILKYILDHNDFSKLGSFSIGLHLRKEMTFWIFWSILEQPETLHDIHYLRWRKWMWFARAKMLVAVVLFVCSFEWTPSMMEGKWVSHFRAWFMVLKIDIASLWSLLTPPQLKTKQLWITGSEGIPAKLQWLFAGYI